MPLVKLLDGDDLLAPYATQHLIDGMERLGVQVMIGAGQPYRPGVTPQWPGPAASSPRVLADPLAVLIRSMWFNPEHHAGPPGRPAAMRGLRRAGLYPGLCPSLASCLDFRFGCSDSSIVAAPDSGIIATDRLSSNKAQLLHDHSLSLLLFLEDRPDLSKRYRRQARRRMAGRSWKWARREARATSVVSRTRALPAGPAALGRRMNRIGSSSKRSHRREWCAGIRSPNSGARRPTQPLGEPPRSRKCGKSDLSKRLRLVPIGRCRIVTTSPSPTSGSGRGAAA